MYKVIPMNYIISALNLQQVAKLSVRPWAVGSSLSEPVAQRDRGNHNWEDKCGYITKCTTLHKKYMHVCTCMYMYVHVLLWLVCCCCSPIHAECESFLVLVNCICMWAISWSYSCTCTCTCRCKSLSGERSIL